ncbi:MAG: RNase adaptor protein RapZ, partial [bacterium]|nr:RNase adaptor protein RapZ [bacterium]
MIIIITGMSGAGKSTALKILEDYGFHTIDNIPFELLKEFINILKARKKEKFGLCVDIREKAFVSKFPELLNELNEYGIEHKVIFLDADEKELLRRYSEARRKHPLGMPILKAIRIEKKLLSFAKSIAHFIIDTSNMN